jgi:hypothetical protein
MRFDRLTRHRRPLFTLGVLATCAVVTAATAPAYAGPVGPAGTGGTQAAVHRAHVPSPNAPVRGTVAGALTGAAATRAAGSAAVTDFLRVHQNMLATVHAAKKLHMWWGSFPDTNSGPGVTATQSVSQTLRLSDRSDILYAPTMTPADHSCIEVVTVHTTGTPQIWAWDWCKYIRPMAVVHVNAAFMSTYTTTLNGLTSYTTEDIRTNAKTNTWSAYLFNYQTGFWNLLYTQAGKDQSGLSFGWDMFEFYSSTNPATGSTYVCGDLQKAGTDVESSNISIRSPQSGAWVPGSPHNTTWNPEASPNPASYKCPDMKFNIVQDNSAWMVNVAK